MEIGPIPGIRGIPVAARQGVLRPPAVFNDDGSEKPGEESRQRNGRKAAGAEESDQEDVSGGLEEEPDVETAEDRQPRSVDAFA